MLPCNFNSILHFPPLKAFLQLKLGDSSNFSVHNQFKQVYHSSGKFRWNFYCDKWPKYNWKIPNLLNLEFRNLFFWHLRWEADGNFYPGGDAFAHSWPLGELLLAAFCTSVIHPQRCCQQGFTKWIPDLPFSSFLVFLCGVWV